MGSWKVSLGVAKEKDNCEDTLVPVSAFLLPTAAMFHLQQKLVTFSVPAFVLDLRLEEDTRGDLSGTGGSAYISRYGPTSAR